MSTEELIAEVATLPEEYVPKVHNFIVFLRARTIEPVKLDVQSNDGFGSLSKYANPELLARENSAWELAMRDKYVSR
jgi:hypothetical protein